MLVLQQLTYDRHRLGSSNEDVWDGLIHSTWLRSLSEGWRLVMTHTCSHSLRIHRSSHADFYSQFRWETSVQRVKKHHLNHSAALFSSQPASQQVSSFILTPLFVIKMCCLSASYLRWNVMETELFCECISPYWNSIKFNVSTDEHISCYSFICSDVRIHWWGYLWELSK